MRGINILTLGFLSALVLAAFMPLQAVQAGDEQRAPPSARSAGTLSDQVMRAISSIQELMNPEDENDAPDLDRAKEELDRLYERRYERMNDFEKSTILNFYTNYYLTTENIPEAIRIFNQVLTIEELREDTRLRALRSLGQLNMQQENWRDAIGNYEAWRELSVEEDVIVYRGIAYSHYQLEELLEAEPFWILFMELTADTGTELSRSDYSFLVGLYFTLEDFPKALEVTNTMIMLFDDPNDWRNLSAIYSGLDDVERSLKTLNVAYLKGIFESESRFLNLSQSLAGSEAPYSGSKILEDGYAQGIVEESEENYTTLTQMYMIANLFEEALVPATQAAVLSESGDNYDTLGYINYVLADYQASADAFKAAIDKGSLSNAADTYLFLARALLELEEFDAAVAATKSSAEAGDSSDRENANNYERFVTDTQRIHNTLAERRQVVSDFYESYPELN
jgi:hypothetical protein